MSWRRRLMELAWAGGIAATQTGCPAVIGCGNANPDPCVCNRMPATSPQCVAEKECKDNGGDWDLYGGPVSTPSTDAGTQIEGRCVGYPKDAGMDAPVSHLDGAPVD